MSQDFASAIAALRVQLQKQDRQLRETKRLINQLSTLEGADPPYPDAEHEADGTASLGTMRRDQFYGLPLATAIREYLKMRRNASLGPATVNDIYSSLCSGGFRFDTRNEANAKRGLYISLAKNAAAFHKLPGGSTNEAAVFGLSEWYPSVKVDEGAPKTTRKARRKRKANEKVAAQSKQPIKAATAPGSKPGRGGPHEEG